MFTKNFRDKRKKKNNKKRRREKRGKIKGEDKMSQKNIGKNGQVVIDTHSWLVISNLLIHLLVKLKINWLK